jgi:hypothetical protein
MGFTETAGTLGVSATWHVCEKAESYQKYVEFIITCMPLFSTDACRVYQLSSANFTKKTATVPRVVFAHCEPTSRCHGPFANFFLHSIHDPSAIQSSQSDPESPSDGSAGSPTSPSESRSKYDEEHERNIYPISWRVIGGGVMMGGESTYITRVLTLCPLTGAKGKSARATRTVLARTVTTVLTLTHGKVHWVTFKCPHKRTNLLNVTEDIKTPIEATSSPTSTPRASYFPQAQTHRAADMSTVQQPVPSVPELIPDLSPIALRGRASPSTVSIKENIPPRPFSTPPRISSRAETDITCVL